jgi:hypothetical protein
MVVTMKATDAEIIVEHALLNESNMVLAAKVGASFKELQKRVILRFLERLRDDLQSTFGPEWSVGLELDPSDNASPYLSARRKSWPEALGFGICSDNGCLSGVYIYVNKCSEELGNALLDQELEKSLMTLGRCKPSKPFEFYWLGLDKFGDWGEQDTLVEIYRACEALEYVKALLMRTRDAVAPVIDGNGPPVETGKIK